MKKVMLVATVSLVACGEPIPQTDWAKNQIDMKHVQGFEDCVYTEIKTNTDGHKIIAIRCPNSSVSTKTSGLSGKQNWNRDLIVIDEKATEEKRKKVESLEKQLEKIQAELKEIRN